MTSTEPVVGVTFVQGPSVNWVIVEGARGPVLIDTGYPADLAAVMASLRQIQWHPEELVAILLTHGHGDHIGNAGFLAAIAHCPVYAHENELPNVRREVLDQITTQQLLPHIWRPGVARWALHAIRAGGKKAEGVPDVLALPRRGQDAFRALGVNIVPVPTPGHTRGHVSFYLPDHEILISGDALVTGHPTTRRVGPQLLPAMFHVSATDTAAALIALADCPATVILPGHGPSIRTSPASAIDDALAHGTPY